jgi:16S rRNA (adenine1518-N6/adenine1519-N6)-dimethyltransferase
MSQIDDLPPLREVVRTHGLMAKKSLGQNFLFDLNLTSRIARSAGPLEDATVIEVGPGPGGLTRAILAAGARRVIAIERDTRCLPALAEIAEHYAGRLGVVEADALEFDPRPLVGDGLVRIIANLPYNVGTALLIGWLTGEDWPPWWASLTLMFQREVAERIVADESDPKNYGRLGVLCGWRAESRILFDVPPSAFVPPPKITSSVVHLTPRANPLPCRLEALEAVTRSAFGQRRKMLRQSLKSITPDSSEIIRAAGLEETIRAENISVEGYVALANALDSTRDSRA